MKKKLVVLFVFLFVLVDQFTVVPFTTSFRIFSNTLKKEVQIGPYLEDIKDIEQSSISIKVPDYPDANVTLYSKQSDHPLPLLIYIHGGGFIAGSVESVSFYTKLLASNGYVVASVDYALAPEKPYPTAIFQLVEVLNYLYEHADQYGIDATNIMIGGHSAGAQLASQLGGVVTNSKYADQIGVRVKVPSVKGLFLLSGVYNMDTVGNCHFPFLKKYLWAYTGEKHYLSYDRIDELSTIRSVTSSYPPTFITVGDIDPLASQTEEMIEVLKKNHVEYVPMLWEKSYLYHNYVYHLDTSEARKVYQSMIRFLKMHTS